MKESIIAGSLGISAGIKGGRTMSEQRKVKSYEELEFRDDFMFGKVMEDIELCHDVLECLLQRTVGELKEVQTQKEFKRNISITVHIKARLSQMI